MRKFWIPVGLAVLAAACTDEKSPLAPTVVATPASPLAPPALPTNVPGVLALSMPIDPADSANAAFGLAPFGYHATGHADDGHPGWDIEYRVGGIVRAAAAGTILTVSADSLMPGRSILQIEHVIGSHFYRTTYTNIAVLASAGIAANETVIAGQPLGTAGTITGTVGTSTITYAMTHFQVDDLEFHREGLSSPKAVSPEPFLGTAARTVFDVLWARAVFTQELIEPFPTNPRGLTFPAARTWTRAGGDGPAGIRFTRRQLPSTGYEYELLAESGAVIETGTVVLNVTARPNPTIDLVTSTSRRLGLYDIGSNELRLALANPGAGRTVDLAASSTYRTNR